MSTLTDPDLTHSQLLIAAEYLRRAHRSATEHEGDRTGLNSPLRDLLSGVIDVLDAVVSLIEEGRT